MQQAGGMLDDASGRGMSIAGGAVSRRGEKLVTVLATTLALIREVRISARGSCLLLIS